MNDQRIACLLPSATEIVAELGLADRIVAITHECDYPPAITNRARLTTSVLDGRDLSPRQIDQELAAAAERGDSIYNLDLDRLSDARPTHVVTQELCDVCAVSYSQVQRAVFDLVGPDGLVSLQAGDLDGICHDIRTTGDALARPEAAGQVVRDFNQRLDMVRSTVPDAPRPRVLALEWFDPPWIGGHWVPQLIEIAGGTDVIGMASKPSIRVTWDQLAATEPQVIVAMPCGYNLDRTERELVDALAGPLGELARAHHAQVWAVDANSYFSRPGPRVAQGAEILAAILHPDHCDKPPADRARQVAT